MSEEKQAGQATGTDILMDVLMEEVGSGTGTGFKSAKETGGTASIQPASNKMGGQLKTIPREWPVPGKTKRCGKCGHVLPLEDFSKSASSRDGRQGACKACTRAYDRDRYERLKQTKAPAAQPAPAVEAVTSAPKAVASAPEPVASTPQRKAGRPPVIRAIMPGRDGDGLAKRCATCGLTVPLTGFYRDARQTDGHDSSCKECVKVANRRRYRDRKKNTGPRILVDFEPDMEMLDQLKHVAEKEYRSLNAQILFACKTHLDTREGTI